MGPRAVKRIVLVHDPSAGYCRGILRGVYTYARPSKPWLFRSSRQELDVIPLIRSWDADGIIAQLSRGDFADALRELDLPVVSVSSSLIDAGFPTVCSDDIAVGRKAAEYFVDLGLTEFAYFGYDWSKFSARRREGFAAALQNNGYGFHEINADRRPEALHGQHDWREWDERLRRWLLSLPKPCGVLTCHDVAAVDIVGLCRDSDIHVPDELAILGIDDDELLVRQAYPPLSSVRVPSEQIGYEAARILDDLLQGKQPDPLVQQLPPELIAKRQSTDILAVEDGDLAQALRFIRDNADRQIDVEDVLEAVPINRRTFERRCRALLGRSPSQEIRRVHVERAKQLLIDTDMPTPLVAERSGFANASRLAIIFRKETGEKPTEFRNRHRQR